MAAYVDYWLDLMRRTDALLAVPLLAAGLSLMFAGWRLWRIAVVISFMAVGATIGWWLGPKIGIPALGALASAVILGAVVFFPSKQATVLLGGIVGGAALTFGLKVLGLDGWPLWIAAGTAFFAATALANVYPRHVIILITAFEGGVLVVSALLALGGYGDAMIRQLHLLIRESRFMLPFVILVPTVIGCAMQLADANQKDSGVVKG